MQNTPSGLVSIRPSSPPPPPNNWPLYRSVAYLEGRGLSFGSPLLPPQETQPSAYSVVVDVVQNGRTAVMDQKLEIFADGSLDHVYISPRLENIQDQLGLLREAARKLKIGKHMVVHHQIRFEELAGIHPLNPETVVGFMRQVGRWQLKGEYVQGGECVQIFKKLKGTSGIVPRLAPVGVKRAAVCRFGALGDAIILTPVLRALKEAGYHVTFVGSPYCWPALANNPNIDNVIMQERDAVPNQELGHYWELWAKDYDRYINLSESLEGDLLVVEGRKDFFTSKAYRHSRGNKNYYDYTLARSGFPHITGENGELFFTDAEARRAKEFFGRLRGKFVILWALNGSSHHKVYPMMEPLMREFLSRYPDAVLITVGDEMARLLEFEHPRVIEKAGKWSIRESLIATKYASVVVGPETMITNAAGCFPTPKITILSHSSRENLTKYWENDYSIEPDQTLAPCYPCHQLHYSKESCPIGTVADTMTGEEIGKAPLCSIAVLPMRMLDRLEEVYAKHHKKLT